jgi:beta-phosphoglucomutase-like phosphatase (HAD superfamily)
MFGLPDGVTACLFDMDGVVTQTAAVHAAAWKEMFDDFLRQHAESTGTEFVPFDPHAGYDAYVDGRLDGTVVVQDVAELLSQDGQGAR